MFYLINGSPRRNGNTAQMLEKAAEGRTTLNRVWDLFKKAFAVVVAVVFWMLSYSAGGVDGSILYKIGAAQLLSCLTYHNRGGVFLIAFTPDILLSETGYPAA